MRRLAAVAFVALWCVGAAGQEPALETVLDRAARYVTEYQKGLAAIVSEEHYRQQVMTTSRGGRTARQYRELKSDVLLVKPGDDDGWMQFRDVFEVDQKPVRDRDQRLYRLFVEGKKDRAEQAKTIQDESARYNIGPLTRTINIPIMGMLFLSAESQRISEYKRGQSADVKALKTLAEPADIWVIEFKETGAGTIVRGQGGRDIPSYGRVWLDSRTGRILRTEQKTIDTFVRADVNVTYRKDPAIELLVPAEMREIYFLVQLNTNINGRATYSKFRQFTVTTTEKPKSQ